MNLRSLPKRLGPAFFIVALGWLGMAVSGCNLSDELEDNQSLQNNQTGNANQNNQTGNANQNNQTGNANQNNQTGNANQNNQTGNANQNNQTGNANQNNQTGNANQNNQTGNANQNQEDPQTGPEGTILSFCGAGGVASNGEHQVVHCTGPAEISGQIPEGGGYRWEPGAFTGQLQ